MPGLTKAQKQTAAATRARFEQASAEPTKNRLRLLRIQKGLTQRALSKRAGVSERSILYLEAKETLSGDTDIIAKLAKGLEVKPAVLIGWEK